MTRSLCNFAVTLRNSLVGQVVPLLSIGLIGCSAQDGNGVGLSIAIPLSASAKALTSTGGVTATPGAGGVLLLSDGTHNLTLQSVGIVLREIEFKRAEDTRECAAAGEESDACESFEMGPMLLSVPLDGSVKHEISTAIPAGTYDEVEFDIHKVEGEKDAAFITEHPEFDKLSIRVTGTFDAAAFTFSSEMDEEQELKLIPPLSVTDGVATSVTLSIDVLNWFTNKSGALVNPTDKEQKDVIKENIKRSLKSFEDKDEDGEDDEQENEEDQK